MRRVFVFAGINNLNRPGGVLPAVSSGPRQERQHIQFNAQRRDAEKRTGRGEFRQHHRGYFYYKFIEIKASGKASFDQLIGMRFADWFLTTPLMLLSLVYLMRVNDASERYRCSQSDSPALCENRVFDSSTIPTLISLNMAMLVFGVIFVYTDSPVNWIAYFASVASFVVLSWIAKTRLYDETITPFPAIFVLFVVLWGLYSFAILFGKYNVFGGQIGLNVLDMLSKGAFGVYLYFLSTNTLT